MGERERWLPSEWRGEERHHEIINEALKQEEEENDLCVRHRSRGVHILTIPAHFGDLFDISWPWLFSGPLRVYSHGRTKEKAKRETYEAYEEREGGSFHFRECEQLVVNLEESVEEKKKRVSGCVAT